ncbi:glycosyltransferase family 39 protein [Crocinitomix sp.]|nr:glycosyltransferase family 39 protein [Crocinitomix sp.]
MEKRQEVYLLLALIIIQCLICLPVISAFPISLDEPFSIFQAQKSISELWELFPTGNNPMGHFLVLKGWVSLFGIEPFAVRSLSFIVSLTTLVVLFKFARRFMSANFAFVLVLVFMLLRVNHYVAMEARMYGFFTLFFLLIIREIYLILIEKEFKIPVYRLALWNALLLYMHYLGAAIILFEGIILLIYFKQLNRKLILYLSGSLFITILLYLPQINFLRLRVMEVSEGGTWVAKPHLIDIWVNLVKLFNNQFAIITCFALIVGWRVYLKKVPMSRASSFFLSWFLVGFFGLFIISILFQPFFFIKYLQFLSVPLVFVIVGLIPDIKFDGWKKVIPFTLLIPFVLSFKPIPDMNRDTDLLVTYVHNEKSNSTRVYYCPPHYDLTLAYHYDRVLFSDYKNLEQNLEVENLYAVYGADDIVFTEGIDQIIYVDFDSGFLYPENGILAVLNNNCSFVESHEFKGNFKVYIFGVN